MSLDKAILYVKKNERNTIGQKRIALLVEIMVDAIIVKGIAYIAETLKRRAHKMP